MTFEARRPTPLLELVPRSRVIALGEGPPAFTFPPPDPLPSPDQAGLPFDGEDPEVTGDDVPAALRQAISVAVRAMVEALRGRRAPQQLAGLFDETPLLTLIDRARADKRLRDVQFGSVRAQLTNPHASEVVTRLGRDGFWFPAAMRIEQPTMTGARLERWRVSDLIIGPEPRRGASLPRTSLI